MLERSMDMLTSGGKPPLWLYFLLMFLYLACTVVISLSAGSDMVLDIMGDPVSVYTLAGVFSALSNIFIIFMVVYFRKLGFISALVTLAIQLGTVLMGVLVKGNLTSLPGAFGDIFTMISVYIIYSNNMKIERYQARLCDQAATDRLTGLPNRFASTEMVSQLAKAGRKFTIVSVDLNNFKSINDTLGHTAGNEVLTELAERWVKTVEESGNGCIEMITRQGSDEFLLIINDKAKDPLKIIEKYRSVLERKMTVDGCDIFLTAGFGYAEFPTDTDNAETLFTYADTAMYEAKQSGVSVVRFSRDLLNKNNLLQIEQDLRTALDNDTVTYCLQPQFDCSHKLRGFEALARLTDSSGNQLQPSDFVPVAEKVGIIDKVDGSVFRNSAKFVGGLIKKTGADITLSVNISVKHLMKNDFLEELRDILETSGIPADHLEIEITESIMIDSPEKAVQCIRTIRDMGIKIAIDDFGTGYSSLSYLSNFPADMLKVDKSFIDRMNSGDSSKQYVAAIISIGHIMHFDVITEGVEKPDQLETLRSIGCDYIQGFIWGRPLAPSEAEELVMASLCG